MIPSALVKEVIIPEPLGKGVAKNFSPTFPTFTLKNSSVPNLEGIFLVGKAFILVFRVSLDGATDKEEALPVLHRQ